MEKNIKTGEFLLGKVLSVIFFIFLIFSCQAPLVNSNGGNQNLSLTINYTPALSNAANRQIATSASRLLLPNVNTLKVTLVDSTGKTITQTRAVIGTGATFTFAGVAMGSYTISAQAFDASAVLLFSNSATGQTSGNGTPLVLNLLPANITLMGPGTNSGNLPVGITSFKYVLPSPSSSITLSGLSGLSGISYYLQNSKGAAVADSGGIVAGGATDGTLIITFYNTTTSPVAYNFALIDLAAGLQLYYPFNGNLTDSTGNGYDGTPVAAISYGTDRNNTSNGSVVFDGSSSQFSGATALNHSGNFSVSCWVDIVSSSGLCFIVRSNSGGFFIAQSGTTIQFGVSLPSTNNAASVPLTLGWHHVVGTFDTNTIRLYIDGSTTPSTTGWPGTESISGPVIFGCFNSSYWQGQLDNFRLYNRVLTSAEIAALYSFGY